MANYGYGQPLGYSDEFRKAREADQAAEAQRLKEQQTANEEARAHYLAQLEGKKAEEAKRSEQQLDAELEPAKQQQRRAWLAAHPDKTDRDFEAVWVDFLKPNAVEARNVEALENMKAQLRGSGRYQF